MDSPDTDPLVQIVEQWRRERPDLDPGPLLVLGRMARIVQEIDPLLRAPFAEAGLGNGDFDVLAALRRSGTPYRLTPGELRTAMLVTSGAVTKRIDRLEARHLVRRTVAENDARGRLVTLTTAGLDLVDRLIGTHLTNEARLLEGLDVGERAQLAALLGRLGEVTRSFSALSAGGSVGR